VLQPPTWGVPILVAFYDMHGLQWDYSFPRVCVTLYNFFSNCRNFVRIRMNIMPPDVNPPPFISIFCILRHSRDSSVRIALGYGLDHWGSTVRFSAGAGNFSLNHRVQTYSGAHPASYRMGTRSSFPGYNFYTWEQQLNMLLAEELKQKNSTNSSP
jgi:hypothetical protein